jgi:hypothetical protein
MNPTNVRGLRAAFLFAAAAAVGASALAQAPIYRCGDRYCQTHCAGGKVFAASDSRTTGQKAQTDEATLRAAKAAGEMEKARLKEEAKRAPVATPPPKEEEEEPHGVKRTKAAKPFTAVAPKKEGDNKKKKAKKKNGKS